MQCLMMDSSFSMVTMQGEDSGIAWETTPSRCTTPWMSEVGIPSAELSSQAAVRPATPGSHPAGKIIFVMDEELISRRKKTKERNSGPKSKADRKQEVLGESSENISGRPELVEVSQPNVKTEGEQEEPTDPLEDKEQQLFSLVSEGSEILNIVVPPKLATVDEEVSKEMMDNLSYLEETLVPKAIEETHENEMLISIESGAGADDQFKPRPPVSSMDPPGAPVARMPSRGAVRNVDYFEAFALIDAQAPGGPAVTAEEQVEPEAKTATESQDTEKPVQPKDISITKHADIDKSDTISMEELSNELLDEVFYGGTDDYFLKSPAATDGGGAVASVPSRLPSKPSGSNLFESQEDILTPIFLPEGPPKIIDPILLEEPKAMAFLYTDLYEEALGSWKKEEDTESVTSEKSFHSRHSDREARGYLEKYVLIDETPVVEVEPTNHEKSSEEDTRIMSQDFYDLGVFVTKPAKGEMPNSEEEITDFFRSSASSSPCDIEPVPRLLEEDDAQQPTTKSKTKTERSVSITAEKAAAKPLDEFSISSFEFPSDEWASTDDHPTTLEESNVSVQDPWKQDSEMNKPVAPPRKKVTSPPKASLELTPLTPVDVITQENEEAGGKEQREEEKETASPAETADEGDGDGEENALSASKAEAENMPENDEIAAEPAEGGDARTDEEERSETETVTLQNELEMQIKSSETDQTENNAEKQEDASTVLPAEPVKNKGQCMIL